MKKVFFKIFMILKNYSGGWKISNKEIIEKKIKLEEKQTPSNISVVQYQEILKQKTRHIYNKYH